MPDDRHYAARWNSDRESCSKCERAKQILTEWIDQQGHDRCWYYPDLYRKLIEVFDIKPSKEPNLPPKAEFEQGCKRYQDEEYT